jgi:hypothetical protein
MDRRIDNQHESQGCPPEFRLDGREVVAKP